MVASNCTLCVLVTDHVSVTLPFDPSNYCSQDDIILRRMEAFEVLGKFNLVRTFSLLQMFEDPSRFKVGWSGTMDRCIDPEMVQFSIGIVLIDCGHAFSDAMVDESTADSHQRL